jgi:hypothetical protein
MRKDEEEALGSSIKNNKEALPLLSHRPFGHLKQNGHLAILMSERALPFTW